MSTNLRPEPIIPDHEVLRKIGGGAYGEVWMARGITGAYRAVKVVKREDFEDERSFEREFEGILKFEPISRDHPGLVNILHVGRSPGDNSFYYYVMELGDDINGREEFSPVEYEARTLRSDIKSANGKAQALNPCIETAIRLAEGLQHLHENGLSHRDVKPANIIFVNGKARLADIGLVADSGQRTFVGTEGFVPPEGPGSAQADVYSLGKVIYEISTGKDRMQFPEVPDELHPDTDPKKWGNLNEILCDICAPQISKRQIKTASVLADSLKRLQQGKPASLNALPLKKVMVSILVALVVLALYLASPYFILTEQAVPPEQLGSGEVQKIPRDLLGGGNTGQTIEEGDEDPVPDVPEKKYNIVNFTVEPPDAEVYTVDHVYLGQVGEHYSSVKLEVGTTVHVFLKKEGYEPFEVIYPVPDGPPVFPLFTLKLDQPPIEGEKWWDVLELVYLPSQKSHRSGLITNGLWESYVERNIEARTTGVIRIPGKIGKRKVIYLCAPKEIADEMANWLTKQCIIEGRLDSDFEIVAEIANGQKISGVTPFMISDQVLPFRLLARKLSYASMYVETNPKGAKLVIDSEVVGVTGEKIDKVLLGEKIVEIQKEGFKTATRTVVFKAGEHWDPGIIELEKNDSIVWGKQWEKKTGGLFIPLTENVMVAAHELKVSNYRAFTNATQRMFPKPSINNKPDEPIVYVTYQDAVEYAEWLTEQERDSGMISLEHKYRIPTDEEWSLMVGLDERKGVDIATLATENENVYPLGEGWEVTSSGELKAIDSTVKPFGNVCDDIRKKYNTGLRNYFKGYNDGNSGTSAVGIYPPNKLGIHDLAGNVSEWVSNRVGENQLHVVRGANYKTYFRKDLRSSYRTYLREGSSSDSIGIRLVIELVE